MDRSVDTSTRRGSHSVALRSTHWWYLANRGHTQDYFSSYLTSGNGKPAVPFGDWVASRLRSLANTVVPLRSYLTSTNDPLLRPVGASTSPDIHRFSFSYYNTLPFAVGAALLPGLPLRHGTLRGRSFALFASGNRPDFPRVRCLLGCNDRRCVREGAHFIVVLSLIAAFLGHTVMSPGTRLTAIVRLCATARVAEVLFMVLVPTIATSGVLGSGIFYATDVLALVLMIGGSLALGWITWRVLAPDGRWLSTVVQAVIRRARSRANSPERLSTPRDDVPG